MLKRISLPTFEAPLALVRIHAVHVRVGQFVEAGERLFDLTVEFDAGAPSPCPPISHYCLMTRDAGWVSRLNVSRGEAVEQGGVLALLGETAPDEGGPIAEARLNLASILVEDSWWSNLS